MSALTDSNLSPQEKWSLLASQMHQKALDDKYYQEKGTKLGVHNDRFRDGLQRSNYGGDDLAQILMAQQQKLQDFLDFTYEAEDQLAQMMAETREELEKLKERMEQYSEAGFFIDEEGDLVDEQGNKLTGEALAAAEARRQKMEANGDDMPLYATWLEMQQAQESLLARLQRMLGLQDRIDNAQENAPNMSSDEMEQEQGDIQDELDDIRKHRAARLASVTNKNEFKVEAEKVDSEVNRALKSLEAEGGYDVIKDNSYVFESLKIDHEEMAITSSAFEDIFAENSNDISADDMDDIFNEGNCEASMKEVPKSKTLIAQDDSSLSRSFNSVTVPAAEKPELAKDTPSVEKILPQPMGHFV